MNVELLRKVQAYINEHPEELDMVVWHEVTPCGSVACICGHAALLSGAIPPEPTGWTGADFAYKGAMALGIIDMFVDNDGDLHAEGFAP